MKISQESIKRLSKEYSHISNAHEFLFHLGIAIREELYGLRLFGEIERPEGKDTYEALRDALKTFFVIKHENCLNPSYFDDPERRAVISLYLVWAGVFHYGSDSGNEYWKHVFRGLGFAYDAGVTIQLRQLFLKCVKENNLEAFPKITGGRKYVTLILLHGLIPEKHIRRFIHTYILGEFSAVRARYFTGRSLIKKWCGEPDIKTQPVPIQNFIQHGQPVNADVVDRFWEMVEDWEDDAVESWWRWQLPKYMVDAFKSCLDAGDAPAVTPSRKFGGRPCLIFDLQKNDFPVLNIPSQPTDPDSELRIESKSLRQEVFQSSQNVNTIRIGEESIMQGLEVKVHPSEEWNIFLSDKSLSVVYRFPEDDTEGEIPVYLFNNTTGKSINYETNRKLPEEMIMVFPRDAHVKIEGGQMLTESLRLSGLWRDWNFVYYQLTGSGVINYKGPDIGFTRKIHVKIEVSGDKSEQDIPFLEHVQRIPSWVTTDGNLPILTDPKSLKIRFSQPAQKAWRRGMGMMVRFNEDSRRTTSYFRFEFKKDDNGFYSKPSILEDIKPGVYEIRIRGALGVEDIVLPFVYIPILNVEKRGIQNVGDIADRFVIDFSFPIALDAFTGTSIERPRQNKAVIKFEQDRGEAFCAIKLFKGSRYPVTLLLARSAFRWVRRSEKGLFHWYDWRAVAEEIPIDRLKELQDTRVLIEIDTSQENLPANIHETTNRLRVLLKNMADESNSDQKVLMSFNAPNYKRGQRDVWVLDLEKFADQMKSVKDSGHAELVLGTYGSYPETVLYRLLRFSEYRNFRVESQGVKNGKENLKIIWAPHPNEARKNRWLTFRSSGDSQSGKEVKLSDNEKPPLILPIDAVEKPEIWSAKIEISQSRFSSRAADNIPNAETKWLRTPENWKDWIDIPDTEPGEIPPEYLEFLRLMGPNKAQCQMPWLSFLVLFHKGTKQNQVETLSNILGSDWMKHLFPYTNGVRLQIRCDKKTVASIRILSDTLRKSMLRDHFEALPPCKWWHPPEKMDFEFSVFTTPTKAECFFMYTADKKEPEIKHCGKVFSLSDWLADEKGVKESGDIVPMLPISSIWVNPTIVRGIWDQVDCEDTFSYEYFCLQSKLSNFRPVPTKIKKDQTHPTALSEAFIKCMENKKLESDNNGKLLQKIDQDTRKTCHSLIDQWDEWSKSDIADPIIRKMIRHRLNRNPLDALSGAVALHSRFNALGYQVLTNKSCPQSLVSETRSFCFENLAKSVLRDLVLSEILLCWYWEKKYFRFKAAPACKPKQDQQQKHPKQSVIGTGYRSSALKNATVEKTPLESHPRNLSEQDINRIWKKRGFYKPGSNPGDVLMKKFQDKGDETILDSITGLLWQKNGTQSFVTRTDARKYVEQLNREGFAGYQDWRLPTIEELGSLLFPAEHTKGNKAKYISNLFSKKQIRCWSSDLFHQNKWWLIDFCLGEPRTGGSEKNYVRAVRTFNSNTRSIDHEEKRKQ